MHSTVPGAPVNPGAAPSTTAVPAGLRPTAPPGRGHRGRRAAVAVGLASALGAAVYAQLHRDEFEAMARHVELRAEPQT